MILDWDESFGSYGGGSTKSIIRIQEFRRARLSEVSSLERDASKMISELFPEKAVYREVPAFGRYIFDFMIPSLDLVVEVDGPRHDTKEIRKKDKARDKFCKKKGLRVVRLHYKKKILMGRHPSQVGQQLRR